MIAKMLTLQRHHSCISKVISQLWKEYPLNYQKHVTQDNLMINMLKSVSIGYCSYREIFSLIIVKHMISLTYIKELLISCMLTKSEKLKMENYSSPEVKLGKSTNSFAPSLQKVSSIGLRQRCETLLLGICVVVENTLKVTSLDSSRFLLLVSQFKILSYLTSSMF